MLALLLLCCVPLALADPITSGCCFPRQWSAVVMENGGVKLPGSQAGQEVDYLTHMYFDLDQNMLLMDRDGLLAGKPDKPKMYFNYASSQLHYINHGVCTRIEGTFVHPELCLSNGYHYIGRHVIGSKGNNVITDRWSSTTNATSELYVAEDCTPLIQVYTDLVSPSPTQIIQTFGNFSAGVPAGIFDLPTSCQT